MTEKMSEDKGFRVTAFFNLLFNDQKSRSSIYVNTNRCKTVQALKEHISHLFEIPHGNFNLHCNNNFLPPEEDIRVLEPEDTVLIVPNKLDIKKKRKRSAVEIVEQTDIQEIAVSSCADSIVPNSKIRRKRSIDEFEENGDEKYEFNVSNRNKTFNKKMRKESLRLRLEQDTETSICKECPIKKSKLEETSNNQAFDTSENGCSTIEKITFFEHLTHSSESNLEKAKDSMKRCNLPICKIYNIEKTQSVEESPLKETPTIIPLKNKVKRSSTPYRSNYQPIGKLLEVLKSASAQITECNDENVHEDANTSITKKRKRYRKRKRPSVIKIENITEMTESSDTINVTFPSTSNVTQRQRTHIKFSDDVEIIPDTIPQTVSSRPEEAIAVVTMDGGNSTDSAIEVIEVASSGGEGVSIASILSSPSMKNITPKAGDLIAFKMLRLTDSYTPEVSSRYITAKTVFYDILSRSISLQIIEGGDQMDLPNGKFSLEVLGEIEENGRLSEEITVSWGQLIDPRLLYP